MPQAGSRSARWPARVLLALTLLLLSATLMGACLLQPTPWSLLAPLLGPWAGLAYGHSECTLGNQRPLAAWTTLSALLLASAGLFLARDTRLRFLASAGLVLVLAAWSAAAFLSVLNTTS